MNNLGFIKYSSFDIISLPNNGKYKLEMYFSKINETILNNINNIIGKYEYIIEEYNDKN